MSSDDPLVAVFQALDTENKGYITIDQFTSTFKEFYNSNANANSPRRKLSTAAADIKRLVNALDPEHDGIIYFSQFKTAFEGNVLDDTIHSKGSEFLVSKPGPDVAEITRSSLLSDALENKTDDSGVNVQDPSMLDCDNDSCLSAEAIQGFQLKRGEIRSTWPKHAAIPLFSPHQGTESPISASRSDILMDDMETNFELIRDQMRQMQEQVENLQNCKQTENESRLDRLRAENACLIAQVTVLEERLKEADARCNRVLEAERQHMQSMLSRSSREYMQETENLRSRISELETECAELRVGSARIKADNQASIIDLRRNTEALNEAQDQIRSLQQELSIQQEKHAHEIELLRKDRDHAVSVLEELNGSIGGKRNSRQFFTSSGALTGSSEVLARYQEVQEIVKRLTAENKTLRQQLEEAQEELLTYSLAEGRSLVRSFERSWAAEIDNCTKEEVVELLSKEKHANEQLRKYIDNLITRILERHPSLLEIAGNAS